MIVEVYWLGDVEKETPRKFTNVKDAEKVDDKWLRLETADGDVYINLKYVACMIERGE